MPFAANESLLLHDALFTTGTQLETVCRKYASVYRKARRLAPAGWPPECASARLETDGAKQENHCGTEGRSERDRDARAARVSQRRQDHHVPTLRRVEVPQAEDIAQQRRQLAGRGRVAR